jgi:hypothetical protein
LIRENRKVKFGEIAEVTGIAKRTIYEIMQLYPLERNTTVKEYLNLSNGINI